MLIVVNYIGWFLLSLLIGSWDESASPRARTFTLALGSLVLGLVSGLILYVLRGFYASWEIDRLDAFVLLPAGVIILIFVIEGIKRQIQKNAVEGPP